MLSSGSLRVATVRITADAVKQYCGVTYYDIEVFPEGGGASWHVRKRYNDFAKLASTLGREVFHTTDLILGDFSCGKRDGAFPRKHLRGCEGPKLQGRRRALQAWLRHVVQHPHCDRWMFALHHFLEVWRYEEPTKHGRHSCIPSVAAKSAEELSEPSAMPDQSLFGA